MLAEDDKTNVILMYIEDFVDAKRLIEAADRDILICIDGGITRANVAEVAGLGPDLIVTGSAVFDGKAPAENARAMLEAIAAVP